MCEAMDLRSYLGFRANILATYSHARNIFIYSNGNSFRMLWSIRRMRTLGYVCLLERLSSECSLTRAIKTAFIPRHFHPSSPFSSLFHRLPPMLQQGSSTSPSSSSCPPFISSLTPLLRLSQSLIIRTFFEYKR